MTPIIPIPPGARFGRLTVVGVAPRIPGRRPQHEWECLCDCGERSTASAHYLVRGRKKSCGCERYSGNQRTHGEAVMETAEYRTWSSMKSRCLNPNHVAYRLYGARGITVAQEWQESFEAFLAQVGRRPDSDYSLDRIDVNGNYEPGNVRWATRVQQGNNRRNNHPVTIDGVTRTIAEWSEISGLSWRTIAGRLDRDWPPSLAVSEPASHRRALFPRKRHTHCQKGHAVTGDNVYRAPGSGRPHCLTCIKERGKNWRTKKALREARKS